MATIPTWLIGRNVTSINIVPQSPGVGGVLTASGAQSLSGLIDEINWTAANTTEQIVPMDSRAENEVITGTGLTMTLVEILNLNNILQNVSFNADYVQITFTRASKTATFYFVVGEYGEGYRRGKSVGTLSLKPCGIVGNIV